MSRLALLFVTLLAFAAAPLRGGIAEYTDRGKTDFDTVMVLLNPYGTWAQVDGFWSYTPTDHMVPYTRGRWLYTEYGWYWKGDAPHSWATEHYGYWKRNDQHVWSWYPTPYWLPEIVEMRSTSTHIGWRSAAVDENGSFIEAPADRYAKVDEWNFVALAQFAGPITSDMIMKPDVASKLLDDSAGSEHTYVTYRPIDRPGPHPADFTALSHDNGMFAPSYGAGDLPPAQLLTPVAAKTTSHDVAKPASTNAAPSGLAKAPTSGATTNAVTGTPMPGATGIPDADGDDASVDLRQVRVWVTMSLPSYWTTRPADARPNELYIYRPDFYQDQDGIERRIRLWLNPSSRLSAGDRLRDVLGAAAAKTPATTLDSSAPAIPATPVPDTPERNPFHSPLDDSFHGSPAGPAAPSASSKAGSSTNAAP